jgi:hypothetical protein
MGWGDEVGVEDCDELSLRLVKTSLQRSRLIPGSLGTTNVIDAYTVLRPASDEAGHKKLRLVRRVIQHLDLQTMTRPVQCAGGIDEPFNNVDLVIDR